MYLFFEGRLLNFWNLKVRNHLILPKFQNLCHNDKKHTLVIYWNFQDLKVSGSVKIRWLSHSEHIKSEISEITHIWRNITIYRMKLSGNVLGLFEQFLILVPFILHIDLLLFGISCQFVWLIRLLTIILIKDQWDRIPNEVT